VQARPNKYLVRINSRSCSVLPKCKAYLSSGTAMFAGWPPVWKVMLLMSSVKPSGAKPLMCMCFFRTH